MQLNARISAPSQATRGEIVEIKTLVSHPMESGFRRNNTGAVIPRNIITHFSCRYNNQPVFTAEFGPGVAANPFLAFYLQASSSGDLLFSWTDQHGNVATATRNLQVVDG
jgi:sulfur-oxidizing protein SoxZ